MFFGIPKEPAIIDIGKYIINKEITTPVSYTHLDVYKRQYIINL